MSISSIFINNNKIQQKVGKNTESLATETFVLENIENLDESIIPKITNNKNTWSQENTFETNIISNNLKTSNLNSSKNAELTKYSFKSQIIKFKDIREDYIIDNNDITNYVLLNGVNNITLPTICEDGQTIYIKNYSNGIINILSEYLMYHIILTPITGSYELIINPKLTICLIFNNFSEEKFWSIIV